MYSWQYASQPQARAFQILQGLTPMKNVKVLHPIFLCEVQIGQKRETILFLNKPYNENNLNKFYKKKISLTTLAFLFFFLFFSGAFYTFFLSSIPHTVNQSYVRCLLFFPILVLYLISPGNDISFSFVFTEESLGIYCF